MTHLDVDLSIRFFEEKLGQEFGTMSEKNLRKNCSSIYCSVSPAYPKLCANNDVIKEEVGSRRGLELRRSREIERERAPRDCEITVQFSFGRRETFHAKALNFVKQLLFCQRRIAL
ncbi:uncharacterized protein J3R85_015818 [Psidium guajava]|nr:uncharacterized protein J3R85_015818 [Psidium guajava]